MKTHTHLWMVLLHHGTDSLDGGGKGGGSKKREGGKGRGRQGEVKNKEAELQIIF